MKCYMTGKPCDYDKPDDKNKNMFIVSPFGFPFDTLYKEGSEIQRLLIKKCSLERAYRADQTMRLGSIMCQGICKEIVENQYLYADISYPNPNVYYELGLAYARSNEIIVAINEKHNNQYSEMLTNSFIDSKTFISYSDFYSLKSSIDDIDITEPIKRNAVDINNDKPVIAMIENPGGSTSKLYELIIKELQKDFCFDEDDLKTLTESEKESFSEESWKKWDLTSLAIEDSLDLSVVVNTIAKCKICIVDTTVYQNASIPVMNPYMFFCLGLAHGLEKEVIPITNTLHSSGPPFDVKGLWHIFFSKEEELISGFKKIIPKISVEFHREISNAPYHKIWDGMLVDKKILSVIYCGRTVGFQNVKTSPKLTKRGSRTNIDSWDTKAVSEVSFYLAQKYPTSRIKPVSPRTKVQNFTKETLTEITERIKKELKGPYKNCIIVGSPDVNDYAEIVLAEIYGLESFNPKMAKNNGNGFIFYKNNISTTIESSFYLKDKKNKNWVRYPKGTFDCQNDATFGVLTIARNPFVKNGNSMVIVLSGFTGLATCALMELLIESELEIGQEDEELKKEKKFKENLNSVLKVKIVDQFDPELPTPFSAIVRVNYDIKSDIKMGDNRIPSQIEVVDTW